MKAAAVLAAPRRIIIEQTAPPRPEAGQVVVRLEGCGVCASNLAPWHGAPWFSYPFPPGSPGHEGWGVVEEVGDGVDGVSAGDRVATLADRAYAEHCLADAASLVPLPAALDGRPFPGEPLGCAMNIFRRSGVHAGHTVGIVGIGFLGALLTGLAARAGARVIAVSRREFARDVARRSGAAETLALGDDGGSLEGAVAELTGGDLCDVVIEAAGVQHALDAAARLVRVRGRLVVAGFHQGGPRTVDMQLWNWRGIDVVNAHERDPAEYVRGMRAAVDATVAGTLDPWPLLTHSYPLRELGQALEHTAQRPDGFLKAIVVNDAA